MKKQIKLESHGKNWLYTITDNTELGKTLLHLYETSPSSTIDILKGPIENMMYDVNSGLFSTIAIALEVHNAYASAVFLECLD